MSEARVKEAPSTKRLCLMDSQKDTELKIRVLQAIYCTAVAWHADEL